VGNPIVDVLRRSGHMRLAPGLREGAVVTAHRPTNVDNPSRLEELVRLLERLPQLVGPVTFPVHPRTRQRLEAAGYDKSLRRSGVRLLEPIRWEAMLQLLRACRVVVTDSGGLQEEAAYFGVPVVVLRASTPRWEGVEAGTSALTGLDADAAIDAVRAFLQPEAQERVAAVPCPYGDGYTAERVADVLLDDGTRPLFALREPASWLPPGLRTTDAR
jgi:UDP-N-acetylglucosamine 2-epimerase (non-hydrolysing)